MSPIFYVYQIRDPREELPFYIGEGKNNRSSYHLSISGQNDSNRLKVNKINKIRGQGFEPLIECIYDTLYENEVIEIEKELIAKYGRKNLGNGVLTNLTDGGEGVSGFIRPKEYIPPQSREEVRQAISEGKIKANTKRPDVSAKFDSGWHPTITEEARLKHKLAIQAAMLDPERRAKCATRTGSKATDETRAKMSLSHKNRDHTGHSDKMKQVYDTMPYVCCPHCKGEFKLSPNYHKLHGPRCKSFVM